MLASLCQWRANLLTGQATISEQAREMRERCIRLCRKLEVMYERVR
jgi:hypothetical protein